VPSLYGIPKISSCTEYGPELLNVIAPGANLRLKLPFISTWVAPPPGPIHQNPLKFELPISQEAPEVLAPVFMPIIELPQLVKVELFVEYELPLALAKVAPTNFART
jgi:hypothetical protein